MKITVTMDNNVPFNTPMPLCSEHGVSFLIELDGKRILYDTGQTGAVVGNLTTLGISPQSLDGIVISHGHYDHAGGLLAVLKSSRKDIRVTAHTGVFTERYAVTRAGRRPIGIPFSRDFIQSVGGDWHMSATPCEILPGLWFSGTIPRTTDFEPGDQRFRKATPEGDMGDEVADDTVLYWVGKRGLVVIGGCTHSGLVNAVRHGFDVTGAKTLQGWVGGTHLGPVEKTQQDRTIEQLQAWAPDFVAANHCTGFPVMSRLQSCFGDKFIPAFVGETITVA